MATSISLARTFCHSCGKGHDGGTAATNHSNVRGFLSKQPAQLKVVHEMKKSTMETHGHHIGTLSLSLHRYLRETSSQAEGELKRPLGRSASILNWTRHVYTVCLSDYPIRLHENAPRALLLTVWPFLVIPVSHLCLFCRGGSNHAYSKVKSCFTPQQPRSTIHDHGISRQIACKKIKLT